VIDNISDAHFRLVKIYFLNDSIRNSRYERKKSTSRTFYIVVKFSRLTHRRVAVTEIDKLLNMWSCSVRWWATETKWDKTSNISTIIRWWTRENFWELSSNDWSVIIFWLSTRTFRSWYILTEQTFSFLLLFLSIRAVWSTLTQRKNLEHDSWRASISWFFIHSSFSCK
jgi:hypothetical protein